MDVPLDALSSLRRYALDSAAGALWLIAVLFIWRPDLQPIEKIKLPQRSAEALFALLILLLPYVCGIVGNTVSSAFFSNLPRNRRSLPSPELKREMHVILREATGMDVPESDFGVVVEALVSDRRDPIVAHVVSQVEFVRFRRMLLLPLLIAAVAATCPDILLAIAVFVAGVLLLIFELRTSDPLWKYLYYGALLLRRRTTDGPAARS